MPHQLTDLQREAWEAELARVNEALRRISEAITPAFTAAMDAMRTIVEQHPELLDPPAPTAPPADRTPRMSRPGRPSSTGSWPGRSFRPL